MTTAPYIELGFHPTDLRPRDLPKAGEFLGSPAEALQAALAATRASVITQVKDEARGLPAPTQAQLLRLVDLAWQGAFWRYRKMSVPIIFDAYVRAYRDADAGDVPNSVLYSLAEAHAEKVGEYFHVSSKEALAQGFNTLVNRRVPAKAAADRVLDAYGLTPRQMRGYTAASTFDTPVSDVLPRSLKARARAYIDKAFLGRIKKLSVQEEHNLDEQAKQYAWMWLQDKGRLPEQAQKLWITAKDERVCPVCGPLHNQRVAVNERFRTSQGEFWTPGLHPNCRCVVRLLEHRFSKSQLPTSAFGVVAKADWDPREHPRGGDPANRGRFSRRSGPQTKEVAVSPAVEEMVTRAEQLRQEKPVIETAPEEKFTLSAEETFELGAGRFRLGRERFSLSPEKFSLGESEKFTLQREQLEPGQPKRFRITPEEIAQRMELSPQQKMRLTAEVEAFLLGDAVAPKRPAPKPLKSYYRPTVFLHDATGKERPYYAIQEDDVLFDPETGSYQMHHYTVFTPNLASLAQDVVERRQDKIRDAIDSLVNQNTEEPILWHPTEGAQFSADIPYESLEGAVQWLANGSRPSDDQYAEIEWVDRSGNRHPQRHRYSEIIGMMGDRARNLDLEVRILRLDEAHDSREGQTVYRPAGSALGKSEFWTTDGMYSIKDETSKTMHSEPEHEVRAVIVSLDPDVEEKETTFTPFLND